MVTIDNENVSDLTIDGVNVKEVTIDGTVVWLRDYNFYIEYETNSGNHKKQFITGEGLRQFILDNKTTFINHCKVVAKLPEITNCYALFAFCTASSIDLSNFNTSNVTSMYGMFSDSEFTSIDLSNFDTSNVTSMREMFAYAKTPTLDLSSFDTSNVTNMDMMFGGSQITVFDLSSFDTTKVTGTFLMFALTPATIGYARTQADADKFNSSYAKPLELTFVVK